MVESGQLERNAAIMDPSTNPARFWDPPVSEEKAREEYDRLHVDLRKLLFDKATLSLEPNSSDTEILEALKPLTLTPEDAMLLDDLKGGDLIDESCATPVKEAYIRFRQDLITVLRAGVRSTLKKERPSAIARFDGFIAGELNDRPDWFLLEKLADRIEEMRKERQTGSSHPPSLSDSSLPKRGLLQRLKERISSRVTGRGP